MLYGTEDMFDISLFLVMVDLFLFLLNFVLCLMISAIITVLNWAKNISKLSLLLVLAVVFP